MQAAVGKPVIRKEGRGKVTGTAIYVDDFTLPGMLHGVTIRTPCARGRIRGISFAPHIPWDEFVVVTAKDIPGHNVVALIAEDQPYLAEHVFHHAEEPVALLAHPDKHLLEEARRAVTVEVEPVPPVLKMEDSGHVFKSFRVEKGDIDSVWADADFVVEGDILDRRAGAALHREQRHGRGRQSRRGRRHRVGFDAVPLLHPQGPNAAIRPPAGQSARRPTGNRRRIRRQGRISVDHRGARRAAGVEIRESR